MGDKTGIEWTDATWNAVVGCSIKSPGCTHCYAMGMAARIERMTPGSHYTGTTKQVNGNNVWTGVVKAAPDHILTQPIRWKKPRLIFTNSMSDLFHEDMPESVIDEVFAIMGVCPQHTFQVLTKRADRMRAYVEKSLTGKGRSAILDAEDRIRKRAFPEERSTSGIWMGAHHAGCRGDQPMPNVWLGVSVEDQKRADERIPDLLATPAAIRWISAEPLLGPVDIGRWIPTCYECGVSCGERVAHYPKVERCFDCGEECDESTEPAVSEGCPQCGGELEPVCPSCNGTMVYQHPDTPNLDWVVVGGESGPKARPMHPSWARSLRDQCTAAGVPFLFKQWGEWVPQVGAVDGWTIDDNPEISRFDHRDWGGDRFGECYRPMWDQERDDDTVSRVGKKRAGRLLDGVEHNGYPVIGGSNG